MYAKYENENKYEKKEKNQEKSLPSLPTWLLLHSAYGVFWTRLWNQ